MRVGHVHSLRRALTKLRVFDQEWRDLAYPPGDPRGAIPDAEMPPEYLVTRDELRSDVTYLYTLVAGESEADAKVFADAHSDPNNPYNFERARMAVALTGRW